MSAVLSASGVPRSGSVLNSFPDRTMIQDARLKAHTDLRRLFTGDESGHLGPYGYMGEGAAIVEEFYRTHKGYYVHEVEAKLLEDDADPIAECIQETERLLIVGPGPRIKEKVLFLKNRLPRLREVVLIDTEASYCTGGEIDLREAFRQAGRDIIVSSIVSDYRDAINALEYQEHTTAVTLGSLLSNITREGQAAIPAVQIRHSLESLRDLVGKGGYVVVGFDSCQDPERILKSYDHPLFDRFILHQVAQPFGMAEMHTISSRIREYFRRETVAGELIVPHHNVVALKPFSKEFITAKGGSADTAILEGSKFTTLFSAKLPTEDVATIGKTSNMNRLYETRSPLGPAIQVYGPV